MESEAVARVRRELEAVNREQVDRISLANRALEQSRKEVAEKNAAQAQTIQKVAERVRAMGERKAAESGKQKEMDFGIGEEEEQYAPPPPPPRPVAFEEPPPAPKPTQRRPGARRAAQEYEEDDYSSQTWLQ